MEPSIRHKVQEAREKLLERDKYAQEQYAAAVRKVFSTPEGEIFGRGLVFLLGVNRPTPVGKDYPLNAMLDNIRREVYHSHIRAYLTPSQKAKLES